jgi:hypothetical protein
MSQAIDPSADDAAETRPSNAGDCARRPWTRPVLETRDLTQTEVVIDNGPGGIGGGAGGKGKPGLDGVSIS